MRKGWIAVAAGAALLSATPVQGATKKTVKLGDNYFTPKTVTVNKGTTVTWRWPGFEEAGDVHDVKLRSGPKGVKKFQSEAGVHAAPRDGHDDQGPEVGRSYGVVVERVNVSVLA